MSDTEKEVKVSSACADEGPDNFHCERPRGHDGPHRALIGTPDTIEWED